MVMNAAIPQMPLAHEQNCLCQSHSILFTSSSCVLESFHSGCINFTELHCLIIVWCKILSLYCLTSPRTCIMKLKNTTYCLLQSATSSSRADARWSPRCRCSRSSLSTPSSWPTPRACSSWRGSSSPTHRPPCRVCCWLAASSSSPDPRWAGSVQLGWFVDYLYSSIHRLILLFH